MKHRGYLFGIGGLLAIVAVAVAGFNATGGISISSIIHRLNSINLNDLSVTFNSKGTQSHSDNYTYYRSATTALGNTFYLRNRTNVVPSASQAAVMCGNYDKGSIEPEITFTTANTGTTLFEFKNIKSISAISNSSTARTLTVYKSSDGTNWSDAGSLTITSSGGSNSDVAGAKYIKLGYTDSNFSVYITSFTINYSCSDEPEPEKELSSITVSGQTTEFIVGDEFSFGGTVTAHYSDSSSKAVTDSAIFSGYDMSSTGQQTVTVAYTENDIEVSTTYSITVSELPSGPHGSYRYAYSSYACTITFSGSTGTYSFKDWDSSVYSLNFSYSVSDNKVSITLTSYATGSSASSFANYRLFEGSNTKTTATYNSDTDVMSITTYTTYGTSTTRSFGKVS